MTDRERELEDAIRTIVAAWEDFGDGDFGATVEAAESLIQPTENGA